MKLNDKASSFDQQTFDSSMKEIYSNLGLIKLRKERVRDFEISIFENLDSMVGNLFKSGRLTESEVIFIKQQFKNIFDVGEVSGIIFAYEQNLK